MHNTHRPRRTYMTTTHKRKRTPRKSIQSTHNRRRRNPPTCAPNPTQPTHPPPKKTYVVLPLHPLHQTLNLEIHLGQVITQGHQGIQRAHHQVGDIDTVGVAWGLGAQGGGGPRELVEGHLHCIPAVGHRQQPILRGRHGFWEFGERARAGGRRRDGCCVFGRGVVCWWGRRMRWMKLWVCRTPSGVGREGREEAKAPCLACPRGCLAVILLWRVKSLLSRRGAARPAWWRGYTKRNLSVLQEEEANARLPPRQPDPRSSAGPRKRPQDQVAYRESVHTHV